MPTLRKHRGKETYYIQTSIQGKIITFQVREEGVNRLLASGYGDGDAFARILLFDLFKDGLAYTHGTGPGELEPDERQLALDFKADPYTEEIFPSCSECKSMDDLHLARIFDAGPIDTVLLCNDCRQKSVQPLDISVPLQVVNRRVFSKLYDLGKIPNPDKQVANYKDTLDKDFDKYWEEALRRKKAKDQQDTLFNVEKDDSSLF